MHAVAAREDDVTSMFVFHGEAHATYIDAKCQICRHAARGDSKRRAGDRVHEANVIASWRNERRSSAAKHQRYDRYYG